MKLGFEQLDSSYTALSLPFVAVGPSAWLNEMSPAGVVPGPAIPGANRDYSF